MVTQKTVRAVPTLDVIIVNWNGGAHVRRCLDSIEGANLKGFELEHVVVIDNASSDASMDQLDQVSLQLTIIRNPKNRGFAAACNQGARNSRADYLLFLNPDTILAIDSMTTAIEFMEMSPDSRIGMCGIQLVDENDRVIRSCSRFPDSKYFFGQMLGLDRLFPGLFRAKFMNEWDHTETRQVDVVTGAFLLVRRTAFEALSGFDERFFVYLEDVDLLYAAHRAGWRCYYLAATQAFHKQGGCSEQAKAMRLFYSLRSRILYGYKHFGWVAATGILAGTVLLEPISRLAWAAGRGSLREMGETLHAYAKLWKAVPGLLWNPRRSEKTCGIGGAATEPDS